MTIFHLRLYTEWKNDSTDPYSETLEFDTGSKDIKNIFFT